MPKNIPKDSSSAQLATHLQIIDACNESVRDAQYRKDKAEQDLVEFIIGSQGRNSTRMLKPDYTWIRRMSR